MLCGHMTAKAVVFPVMANYRGKNRLKLAKEGDNKAESSRDPKAELFSCHLFVEL